MKRCLFLFIGMFSILSFVVPARAQQWLGSIKIGSAVTRFSGDLSSGDTAWDPRVGLAAGVAAGYDFGNGFVPQIEFTYLRQGAETDVVFEGVPARLRSNLTYLSVPLLLQYRFDTGGYVHPRLFAGPMVAFQLNANLTLTAKDNNVELTEQDDSIKRRDFGAVAGAALEIDVSGQRLSLDARFLFGLSDITKPNEDGGDTTLKNQGIVFLIGLVF